MKGAVFKPLQHRGRKPRRRIEDGIQASVVTYLRTVLPSDVLVQHVKNEGNRGGLAGIIDGKRNKKMGVVAGFPDIICVLPAGKSLFFELKAPRGRPSPAQEDLWKRMAALGHTCAKVSSIDEVRLTLKALGIATREAA
ncbi:MAG: VRR-NUC domain-containing protein [Armatimonadetes bacterium]|nr:VRR-NUC domain-containing protein [Armatimonadota bacterium]